MTLIENLDKIRKESGIEFMVNEVLHLYKSTPKSARTGDFSCLVPTYEALQKYPVSTTDVNCVFDVKPYTPDSYHRISTVPIIEDQHMADAFAAAFLQSLRNTGYLLDVSDIEELLTIETMADFVQKIFVSANVTFEGTRFYFPKECVKFCKEVSHDPRLVFLYIAGLVSNGSGTGDLLCKDHPVSTIVAACGLSLIYKFAMPVEYDKSERWRVPFNESLVSASNMWLQQGQYMFNLS